MLSSRFHLLDPQEQPVQHAELALVASNGTYVFAQSNNKGVAALELPDEQPGTLLIAHPQHRALVVSDFSPKSKHRLTLSGNPGQGSVIFLLSTGEVPGLEGRLNPIKDNLRRTYIYGDNISFNNQPEQPFSFVLDVPFMAEDAQRHRFKLTVREIIGRTSLLDFEQQI